MPDWRARATDVIPGGSSTGSKRPDALFGRAAHDVGLPTHFVRANGCRVWDTEDREYIDCGMALGAVGLGYADPAVTAAVIRAAEDGNVSSLTHALEVEVAESLVELVPCAEQVRFLRTGAEAGAAAVRLARTYTNRERIIACGYFGWLDWNSDARGVPEATKHAVTWTPFNDIPALEAAMEQGEAPAAIVIEPLVHDIADAEWLAAARRLATAAGAVLIFDEVKTAFRVRTGGVQALHDITPDLTTLGKAMANGYPLSAVVGRAAVMDAARHTWISSTAASETTGLAAAQVVLTQHATHDVCADMARAGLTMRDIVGRALQEVAPAMQVLGPDVMWRLESPSPDLLDVCVAAAAYGGVLLKRGAYQFGARAHTEEALYQLEQRLARLGELWKRAASAVAEAPVTGGR
ncbi:MAG: aminotransferase class III-fold pyridoxal phosphate-dependent enzyme [Gemmatimonadaceae bacterium]|nr:aminotransferase class III-fold pyridoxal phosphate-dependent enzyme [Gemmatimonadaceae bacterium]